MKGVFGDDMYLKNLCDIPHQIREKIMMLYKYELLLIM